MSTIRVALYQLNPVVGDLDGNADRVISALAEAAAAGADLAVFPELVITGYPPEDLVLKPGFVADNQAALAKVAAATERCAAVVGFVDQARDLYNAAAVCALGQVQGVYHKQVLPNYGVFDEQRYFTAGSGTTELFVIAGIRVGVSVCEDAWSPTGPIAMQAAGGADLVVSINASPYYRGRLAERERMLATRAADASCVLVYVNQVGGQDELVFDGASLILAANGDVVASAPQFTETSLVADVLIQPVFRKRLIDPRGRVSGPALPVVPISDATERQPAPAVPQADASGGHVMLDEHMVLAEHMVLEEEVYRALLLGTRDYVTKNDFSDVVIGLSGGIDSSLVATIAADALGPDRVHGVAMPSRFSSPGSLNDAQTLAERLGIDYRVIPIEPGHAAMLDMLQSSFSGCSQDLTEENLQSRIRGVTLMALSNKFGWMVLTTGNKSELAVGYSTLYGDTAGGYGVIKDVFKTMVFRLARWRNGEYAVSIFGGLAGRVPPIPVPVLTKPPSAELRPDQRDDQSLPPYEQLDPILEAYVEQDLTAGELVEAGFDRDLVARVVRMVDLSEYKRRQSPLGVRVSPKAFGRDRRMPITNRYR
ncbi:MAG: NAD+ synthase [Actinomycetota bacterium]|nr:NAD+ synthase [Actinomycetota bacterium]